MKYFFLVLLLLPLSAFAQEFVPLTSIPGLDSIGSAGNGSLADFFNTMYRLCIGAAAVIAVAQIMYAGFLGITQEGSILEKGKIRTKIQSAIFGLVLVLSPAIVFGIIDPRILNLDIANISQLGLSNSGAGGLNEQDRAYIASETQGAADVCGFSITDEQAECVTHDFGNTSCLPTDVSPEERTCFAREMAARADEARQCSAMNIRVGSEVEVDFVHCCTQAGLEAHQVGRTSSYICQSAGTQQSDGPTFSTSPGYFNYLLVTDTGSCTQIMQGSFPDQSACSASYTQETNGTAYSPLMACRQISGASFSSSIAVNGELCPAIVPKP